MQERLNGQGGAKRSDSMAWPIFNIKAWTNMDLHIQSFAFLTQSVFFLHKPREWPRRSCDVPVDGVDPKCIEIRCIVWLI
jgi:hypothetical protein